MPDWKVRDWNANAGPSDKNVGMKNVGPENVLLETERVENERQNATAKTISPTRRYVLSCLQVGRQGNVCRRHWWRWHGVQEQDVWRRRWRSVIVMKVDARPWWRHACCSSGRHQWSWTSVRRRQTSHGHRLNCRHVRLTDHHQQQLQLFDAHCCHMGTAVKHLVPDRVKPSFVFLTSGHSRSVTLRAEHHRVPVWQQRASKPVSQHNSRTLSVFIVNSHVTNWHIWNRESILIHFGIGYVLLFQCHVYYSVRIGSSTGDHGSNHAWTNWAWHYPFDHLPQLAQQWNECGYFIITHLSYSIDIGLAYIYIQGGT